MQNDSQKHEYTYDQRDREIVLTSHMLSNTFILIADDNPVNSLFIQTLLTNSGFKTLVASGGRECIRQAKIKKPDLIVLDINMPDINGIETCKMLKKEINTRDIPVIFVTAATDDSTLKEALESGGIDYIHKPLKKIELLTRIKSVLNQKKLMEQITAEERFQGVLEIAGAVCHELNQPMQIISGYSELLLSKISDSNVYYSNIKIIKDQIERMGVITKKLMKLTKLETKHYIGSSRIIDIDKAADERL